MLLSLKAMQCSVIWFLQFRKLSRSGSTTHSFLLATIQQQAIKTCKGCNLAGSAMFYWLLYLDLGKRMCFLRQYPFIITVLWVLFYTYIIDKRCREGSHRKWSPTHQGVLIALMTVYLFKVLSNSKT